MNFSTVCLSVGDMAAMSPLRDTDARCASVREYPLSVALSSAGVFDDLDELVHAVTLATGQGDEFSRTLDDNTTFGRSCDRNATPASELEQAFVAQHPKRPEYGVCVDAEYCGEILRGRQTLAWLCLAFRDRATN